MQQIRYTIILLLLINSCIEPFNPKLEKSSLQKFVISGEVNNEEGFQYVTISQTTPINHLEFNPVSYCEVKVADDLGNIFVFEEFESGRYRSWFDKIFLNSGTSYKLYVKTPDGVEIESDFDQMPSCPNIDEVYYERQDLPTSNPNIFKEGIQFYINLKGSDIDSRFYKWDITETFEYHSWYPIEIYYDGSLHRISADYSKMICYKTQPVKNIYTINTSGLNSNIYNKIPLHFVDNTTQKLQHQYSIEVIQYALSYNAQNYWYQLQQNATDDGGLFDKQPFNVVSNLKSTNKKDINVLGFFYATSIAKKRFFFNNIPNLDFNFGASCEPQKLDMGFEPYDESEYPIYCITMPDGSLGVAEKQCFDCTLLGGTTNKPSFWPN